MNDKSLILRIVGVMLAWMVLNALIQALNPIALIELVFGIGSALLLAYGAFGRSRSSAPRRE